MGWVDGHWHARDLPTQQHKETVRHSLELANISGGQAIFAMPNTDPPLIDLETWCAYLKLADNVGVPVQFYVHIGLTPDVEQVKRAVEATRKEPRIVGMKAFWGRSTGNLSIINSDEQNNVLETLVKEGYNGVLVGHFEDELEMDDQAYDPANPITWSTKARPESAEFFSFVIIKKMAKNLGFKGKLHVAHVSTREVVESVHVYTSGTRPYNVKLSCGVTPHHLFLDNSYLTHPDGVWYKCNPPLRSPETQQRLLQKLLAGQIPIIESDHAPHTEKDKMESVPASGIISGLAWPDMRGYLQKIGMTEDRIRAVTFDNVVKLYGLEDRLQFEDRPVQWEVLKRMRTQYPHDPFRGVF